MENNLDIELMLTNIHLDNYLQIFQKSGYYTILDCKHLNNEILQEMGISLTGHRKRILATLQSLTHPGEVSGNLELLPFEMEKNEETQGSLTFNITNSIIPVNEENLDVTSENNTVSGSSLSKEKENIKTCQYYHNEASNRAQWHNVSLEIINDSSAKHSSLDNEKQLEPENSTFFEFQGPMVENAIYNDIKDDAQKQLLKTSPTKSFILRNRPVPQLPFTAKDTFPKRIFFCFVLVTIDFIIVSEESQGENINLISPYEETFFSNSEFSKETSGDKFLFTQDAEHNEKSCERYASSPSTLNEALPLPVDTAPEESIYSSMEDYSQVIGLNEGVTKKLDPSPTQLVKYGNISEINGEAQEISPYACFYSPVTLATKMGWLEKLSPHRSCMFQKRWVKFDGLYLSYYSNDRDVFSKGKISLSAIKKINTTGESKFEVVTSQRTFVFRTEKEGDRHDWINTLLPAEKSKSSKSPSLNISGKNGYLELKGYKNKIFTVINGSKLLFSKSKQDSSSGIGITDITLTMVSVKNIDRKSFEITTPFRNFSLTAESEREKQEWIEAIQQSIAETLADYEVAEKIWFNESNRSCADCHAPNPDWASISLGVVICKNCAVEHRTLGNNISKVHSLIQDTTIWTNELVELFIVVGNDKVKNMWEENLSAENMIFMDSDVSQRRMFITQKYKEGRFKTSYFSGSTQDQLNNALCAAVTKSDILETMMLVFNGADVMCPTGDPVYNTTYLLAEMAGQYLQMEFLRHNCDFKTSDSFKMTGNNGSLFYCGFLYKATPFKMMNNRKSKEVLEMKRWWCTIDNNLLKYYENETSSKPEGVINLSEATCLVVHPSDFTLHLKAAFTFEIYFLSESMFLFGVENIESQREWSKAIAKSFVPAVEEYLLQFDFCVLGYLYYKDFSSLSQWKEGWFLLDKACLCYWNKEENASGDPIQLKKLQELTTSSSILNGEKRNCLLLVENGRTLYIHGPTMLDFMVWHSAIEKAAGTDGNELQDQQLSKNNIPIIVNSCIAFVTQYGLGSKYLYLKSGNPIQVREMLEGFKKNARSIKLKVGKHQLEDVTDVLKSFFYNIEDALLTKELYPYWISALDTQNELERLKKYKTIIDTLPALNKATLAAITEHLYRIHKCSDINHLDTHTLATAFSSCLFQTNGQNDLEISVIEDLITYYVNIFNVSEEQVQQMDIENHFITKWKETRICQSGDLLIEVYVERKEPDLCVIISRDVPPTMETAELTNCAMGIRNITLAKEIPWATFEVIENGELERPMHCQERVLETILQWCSLPHPGAAYLLVKPYYTRDILASGVKSTHHLVSGYMKFKEDPPKLLAGNKFQERYFVLRERKLLLYKDIKSIKPEKEWPVSSCKVYVGVKKKLKPPTSWGLTIYFEKHQWYLCCESQESQTDWLEGILHAQYSGEQILTASNLIRGMHVKQEKDSLKLTTMNMNSEKMVHAPSTLETNSKLRSSMGTEIFDCKDESKLTNQKKHHSLINLQSTYHFVCGGKESSTEDINKQFSTSKAQLPPNLIKELNSVLQKHKRDFQE
ncbi:hypothetical protein GDO86_000274 [Hymenochirus boettgeri]|uniref:Arf-GAP with Rho-GAP domain, ANK repeat and PH domain-containing protein 2 n=1 Tax=Hymenochirus boettgeri TaxID=247094 RepID=A0A8T2KDU0_9PIPI|nr:hypothetical protein GDO86_000274 [Hymenochirus boettgeri]